MGEIKNTTKWQCLVCGYIEEGEQPPGKCPSCGVSVEYFVKISEIIPEVASETRTNLSENWKAEIQQVGLYLAYGKRAEEEGYPEVAQALIKLALEEGWHAAEIAKIEGLVGTTKDNLLRQAKAELRAQKEKEAAAQVALSQHRQEAADFFRYTSRDEARHASILHGLLRRYFK